MTTPDIQHYLKQQKERVEGALQELMLPAEGVFAHHVEAMRYSLFVGGKRIRPILCLAAGAAVNTDPVIEERLLPVACALECIHTYSLIHDDLPAMDDDDLRRGHPTNHVKFGEAGAILAGDGLLTFAFDLLSSPENSGLDDGARLRIVNLVSRAAGPLGMVGGQALDMEGEGREIEFEMLRTIHRSKTGALITASVLAGAVAAGGSEREIEALRSYGDALGLAFQIVDDLLDVTSTSEALGKTAGSDAAHAKATYPAYFGVEGTRERASLAVEESLEALAGFSNGADPLRALARFILSRSS